MDSAMTTFPGVVTGRVEDVISSGALMIRMEDGTTCPAEPAWGVTPVPWADCLGCRVLVARDALTEVAYVVGLLDAPPRRQPEIPAELKIQSGRELIIQCGKAKIAMRSDGRIEIRGGHLVSRSSGAHKIRGASVSIN